MRRKEKEVTDHGEILAILENCIILNLAIHDQEYPYAIAVNGAFRDTPEGLVVYFHGANEGKKVSLLKENNKVSFITYNHAETRIVLGEKVCGDTREFESVWGRGEAEILEDAEEKELGLRLLLKHLGDDRKEPFDMTRMDRILVYRIKVKELTCKRSTKSTSVEALRKANSQAPYAHSYY